MAITLLSWHVSHRFLTYKSSRHTVTLVYRVTCLWLPDNFNPYHGHQLFANFACLQVGYSEYEIKTFSEKMPNWIEFFRYEWNFLLLVIWPIIKSKI